MLSKPIILHNFRRSFDINENYLLTEGTNTKYDGKSELKPGTILKVGQYGQFKMQVIQDLGDEIEIKNITKNYKDTPFKRSKMTYKGAFIMNESSINESLNSSQKQIVNDYINLKKAIDDPNYRDTTHTQAALMKVKKKLKEMLKSNSMSREILSMLNATDIEDITNTYQ
jgi:hypothetical protein